MTSSVAALSRTAGSVGQLLGREPVREFIPNEKHLSARWHTHDFPSPLARWNAHPEFEIHLINASHGQFIVGDHIGSFGPGHLVMVGSNLPHDWISDLSGGAAVPRRDTVFQFHRRWIEECTSLLPELAEVEPLLTRAARGIEFGGQSAAAGAAEMQLIGQSTGIKRLTHILALLNVLAAAPADEYQLLSNEWLPVPTGAEASAVVNKAIDYVLANLAGTVRLATAAGIAGMSVSAFSKYFKRASGHTFSDMVRRLRLTHASKLLLHSEQPISLIASEVGYSNLSNFNRQFRAEHGCTPSQLRSRGRAEGRAPTAEHAEQAH